MLLRPQFAMSLSPQFPHVVAWQDSLRRSKRKENSIKKLERAGEGALFEIPVLHQRLSCLQIDLDAFHRRDTFVIPGDL